jgi:hypothetical protein
LRRNIANVTVTDDGRVHISRRKFGTKLLWFFRLQPELTLNLDDIGRAARRLIDGRTTGEILVALQERYPHETGLGERLGQQLAAFLEKRFITIRKPGTWE